MHHSTPSSTRRRRASTAALALLTLASVAACREEVTSPKATTPITLAGPQAAIGLSSTVTLTVRVTDIRGGPANEEGLRIKVFLDSSPTDTVPVQDQHFPDKDPGLGKYKFTVPSRATYKVCVVGNTPTLVADGFADACKTVLRRGTSMDVGAVIAHWRPFVILQFRNANTVLIGGATIGWTTTLGTQQIDSDGNNDGSILSVLPGETTAVYCEITAPPGYQFVNPQCAALNVTWDQTYFRALNHELLPKQAPIPR